MRRADTRTQEALGVIRLLAGDIGPRRPCSDAEKRAARELVALAARAWGGGAHRGVRGYATFAHALRAALRRHARRRAAAALAQPRGSRAGTALALGSAVAGALEGDLRLTPVSDALARQPSVNVVARVPAGGPTRRRVCLVRPPRHHPLRADLPSRGRAASRKAAADPGYLGAAAGSRAARAAPPRRRAPCTPPRSRGMALSLAVAAPSASCAARTSRARATTPRAPRSRCSSRPSAPRTPLEHTEVDLLITSCEESGLLGAQAYARRHRLRAAETTFLNFDTVGGDAPLTYILREGSATVEPPGVRRLVAHARGDRRSGGPELGLVAGARRRPASRPTRRRCARAGGRRSRCSRRADTIPNYHWPTDTYENIDPPTVGRALETGRELLRALDAEARRTPPPAASGPDGRRPSRPSTRCTAAGPRSTPPRRRATRRRVAGRAVAHDAPRAPWSGTRRDRLAPRRAVRRRHAREQEDPARGLAAAGVAARIAVRREHPVSSYAPSVANSASEPQPLAQLLSQVAACDSCWSIGFASART